MCIRDCEDSIVQTDREETPAPIPDTTLLEDLVGSSVNYQGSEGILTRTENGFVVVTQDEDIFIESGEGRTAEALGVTAIDPPELQFEGEVDYNAEDSTFTLRGKQYRFIRTAEDRAGNIRGIRAADPRGNIVTIRDQKVVDRILRQKIKFEEENAVAPDFIDFDDVPPEVQEVLVEEAEATGEEIPDDIPVQTALDKALQLTGLDRERALQAIDEAIISDAEVTSQTEEVTDEGTREEIRKRKNMGQSGIISSGLGFDGDRSDRKLQRNPDGETTASNSAGDEIALSFNTSVDNNEQSTFAQEQTRKSETRTLSLIHI
mgnify:CR=1 FL=1